MWRELLDVLTTGVPLDRFGSPASALGAAFVLGFVFGAIPAGASEVLALGAGAVQPPGLIAPLLVMLTAGHVCGKLVWYRIGTLGTRITTPRLRDWITRATVLSGRHPQMGVGVLASSALTSVPPYHLMVVASGVVRMPVAVFVATSFVARLLRFGAVAMFPGVLRGFLQ